MWELDYKESWVQKNWCFRTVVLEKTLESPLDCKEIQPVHPKGDQSWVFIGRNDVEAEIPILWPPDAKSWLIWKDPDAGKVWGWEEKGMTGWDGWMALPLVCSLYLLSRFFFVIFTSLLYFLDSTYKWSHTISVFLSLWLVSLSVMPSKLSLLLQMAKFCSFLWMSSILLYDCPYGCVYVYIFFPYQFICWWWMLVDTKIASICWRL